MARIELASKEILDLRFGDRIGKDQRTLKHCREVNAGEINEESQRWGPSAVTPVASTNVSLSWSVSI